MDFFVNLIRVSDTKNVAARSDLQSNCTHITGPYWLYEGEGWALDEGITFETVGVAAIESYGDLSGRQLQEMVQNMYGVELGES